MTNMIFNRIGGFFLLVCLFSAPLYAEQGLENYRLSAGDRVHIQVYGEKDLTVETLVGDTGTISYPFLGELRVKGLTPLVLEAEITRGLKGRYLVDPEVTVSILEYRPFYVNGWVEKPGSFPFQPGMTVRKAVALAGGFKERANRRAIQVVRASDPDGESNKISLEDQVQPGDVISIGRSFF